jgi:hypothetical protein
MPKFIECKSATGNAIFINLEQVTWINQINAGSTEIHFSGEDNRVVVTDEARHIIMLMAEKPINM